MRIAQIAPLFEAVPPKLYGGTERVVSSLTEELVAMGHDVTLFASGDSITAAKLDAPWPRALRLDPDVRDWVATYAILIEHVRRRAHEFDVLHFHIDYWPNSVFSRQNTPFLTTLHGRLDLPEFAAVYRFFPAVPLVSISDSQRRPIPDLNWTATVYHGMPEQPADARCRREQAYFAFLGRISPEKGIERAIRIARAAGMKLKVAAKVDNADRDYYEREVAPLLARRQCRVHRRDQRRAEAGIPVRRQGAAVPDRLAGAVRPGDDRGDGLRLPGDRLPPRLGAGGDGRRRDRLRRRERRGGGGGRRAACTRSTAPMSAACSSASGPRGAWRRTISTFIST